MRGIGTVGLLLVFAGCGDVDGGQATGSDIYAVLEAGVSDLGSADVDVAPSGACWGLDDGAACDDGDPCTLDDVCDSGVCVGGRNKVCDANGTCQPGTCQPDDGTCLYDVLEDGTPCQVACFEDATCEAGQCTPQGAEIPCPSPDDPCVDELRCNQSTGSCDIEVFKLDGQWCDTDDNQCTLEACDTEGQCTSRGLETCESESLANPCWTFSCSEFQGCVLGAFLEGNSCNDGNSCTTSDKCTVDDPTKKLCKGTPVDTDDGNPCTDDACVAGVIEHTIIPGLACPLPDSHPCSADTGVCTNEGACEPATGCECAIDSDCPAPDNLCLGPLVCDTSGTVPTCQPSPANAVSCPTPNDPCKQQLCEPTTGLCSEVAAADGTGCDDQDACTTDDACAAGICVGPNPVVCDDNVYCNGTESCDQVLGCQDGPAPVLDDAIDCTVDACDEAANTVTHTPDDAACSDGDVCTGLETCEPLQGGCTGGLPPTVDDAVPCTIDSCDPVTGVSHVIDPDVCGDGDVCNGGEVCSPSAGGCVNSPPPLVNDGISCTIDSCDPVTGVSHVPDDSACDDGDVCNGVELCDPSVGCVVAVPPPVVSDGIDCTLDACDPVTGVSHLADDSLCSNNNLCDGVEFCDIGAGGCSTGPPPVVDDGIDCTGDTCHPVNGVAHTPDHASCNDGSVCTGTKLCDSTQGCVTDTPAPQLDDGIDCTDDTCHPVTGVSHTPNDAHCDNSDACDGLETCVAGSGCQSGTVVDCDDNDLCDGVETCDPSDGSCDPGTPIDSDDGLNCTIDACDPATGDVLHIPNCPAGQTCNMTTGACDGGATWFDITSSINTDTGQIDGVLSAGWQGNGLFELDVDLRIPSGVTVEVTGSNVLQLITTGAVDLRGNLELNGEVGGSSDCISFGPPGATSGGSGGGGGGGAGGSCNTAGGAQPDAGDGSGAGFGSGGSAGGAAGGGGGGAGHAADGADGSPAASGGAAGAAFGSVGDVSAGGGGGGGACGDILLFSIIHVYTPGAAGGSGGGAALVESSGNSVTVSGGVSVRGGDGGHAPYCDSGLGGGATGGGGGGGSGGAIKLRAFGDIVLTATASFDARGGLGDGTTPSPGGDGSDGRIRFEDGDGIVPLAGVQQPAATIGTY